jgi:hypothetical protein
MNDAILPVTAVLDNGRLPPAWTLETAIQAATEAKSSGRIVILIERGTNIILEGAALRARLSRGL